MVRVFIGFVAGVALTLAAINPNQAKVATAAAVDKIHSTYTSGSKALEATGDTDLTKLSPELQAMVAKELADHASKAK